MKQTLTDLFKIFKKEGNVVDEASIESTKDDLIEEENEEAIEVAIDTSIEEPLVEETDTQTEEAQEVLAEDGSIISDKT
jgi:hypothetical protein